LDNYRAGYQRIQSTLPIAQMTDHVKTLCQNLYPPRIQHQNRTNTRNRARDQPRIPVTPATLLKALTALKPGTAYDPFCAYTDTLKSYGLSSPSQSKSQARLQTLAKVLSLILNNDVPPGISEPLAHCRFLALHKDKTNLDKLRPIGIGTTWRRLASSILTITFADTFAGLLLPEGQFGLTIRGGLDFLVHSANCQFETFITTPTANNLPPQRAAILIDLINCWNQMSRDAVRKKIESEPTLHGLLHYFDLMYEAPNKCFFHRPDGTLDFFIQEDGFPQGDPLSPALACLVIHQILQPLNETLRNRAQQRRLNHQLGDDGCGSKSATHAYFDDAFAFLPYEDLPIFIQTIQTLGPPLGIHLNKTKTQILTLPESHETTTTLTATQLDSLHLALSLLNGPDSEIKGGTRLLGQPLGSPSFCASYLTNAASTFAQATKRLCKRINDSTNLTNAASTFAQATKRLCKRINDSTTLNPSPLYTNSVP
jgi:hypothetical protein